MISDRADSREEKEMRVGGARTEKGTEKRSERERVGAAGGRQRRERGIEERNQRRLSAYEVGIVGWRRFARSLRITRRWAPSLPAVQKRSMPRQMFFLNGDELADK